MGPENVCVHMHIKHIEKTLGIDSSRRLTSGQVSEPASSPGNATFSNLYADVTPPPPPPRGTAEQVAWQGQGYGEGDGLYPLQHGHRGRHAGV